MKRILITGGEGQLGRELAERLRTRYQVYAAAKRELDVTNRRQVEACFESIRPHIVIHAAAYTNVDQAEIEPREAVRINGFGTMNIAAAAEAVHAKLIYISTDYVFDGSKESPYLEEDEPGPVNVYGLSKLVGERFVEAIHTRAFIIRTSWLYGKYGSNFVARVLKHAESGIEMRVVNDQFGSPTYAVDVCAWIERLMETERYGTYHVANSGSCSWYEFAASISRLSGKPLAIAQSQSLDMQSAAKRPRYSALQSGHCDIGDSIRPVLRDWVSALREYLE